MRNVINLHISLHKEGISLKNILLITLTFILKMQQLCEYNVFRKAILIMSWDIDWFVALKLFDKLSEDVIQRDNKN